jgi:hypothetical protein
VENFATNVFTIPKNDQSQSGLIKVLRTQGLSDLFLKMIWSNHSTASSFARTSQKSWELLMGVAVSAPYFTLEQIVADQYS